MKKFFTILLTTILIIFLFINKTFAVCPVCTIAVGAGVGLCRYLGIDDLISGTWIGGLILSLVIWTIDWLNKKNIRFLFRKIIIFAFYYSVVIIPFYLLGIIGHSLNKFLGIDKLLFGIICGSFAFLISFLLDNFLRKKNQGKAFFPFQKAVIPILFLVILSLIFQLIC